ncbi:hypothetical protein NPIL_136191 [Nephila pilipes]|uniref:RING-type domain-containing protein n=1 Tax=Nephila pilipes TaxID=299642 RepID=A0A8X6QVK8_NEPPI|nr:hypothetical protein NPIL_136191 [Nephila pilipes]
MKDEETFGYVLFNYRCPNLTEFMDFFVQFRQHLSSLEPSKIVPIISFRESILAQVGQLLPNHYELNVPNFQRLVYVEPRKFEDDAMKEAAERGHGTFLQAIWTEYGKLKLYLLAYGAWKTIGCQTMASWIKLSQTVLDSLYGDHWPNTIFETPNNCAICLQTMHWAEKTVCGHVFHLQCLLRHMNMNNICHSAHSPLFLDSFPCQRWATPSERTWPVRWVEGHVRRVPSSLQPILFYASTFSLLLLLNKKFS